MPLQHSISSPLEAGTSIFAGRSMPANLGLALEHISKKLSQKTTHLTFVVLQHDYHHAPDTPSIRPSDLQKPCQPSAETGSYAKVMSGFSLGNIKRRVRGSTFYKTQGLSSNNSIQENLVDMASMDRLRHSMGSPAYSDSPMSMASTPSMASTLDLIVNSPRLAGPLSSNLPCSVPATPATPCSAVSSSTNTMTTEASSLCHGVSRLQTTTSPRGVTLMQVTPLSTAEKRIWKRAVQTTKRKLHLDQNCFPDITTPSDHGLNADVVHWSLVQNEVLFSSESLTLLAPDRVYTFKSTLASYSTTQASSELEDAVNELRRLVLVQYGRKLSMSTLMSRYTWFGPISRGALEEVTRMYRRAYGGPSGESGLDVDADDTVHNEESSNNSGGDAAWPLPNDPVCLIDSAVHHEALSEVPSKASSSRSSSEYDGSSTWDTEDSRSLIVGRSSRGKRCAMVDVDFRFGLDLEELSHTRDVLTEQEEAETAAWLSGRNSGEAVDFAERVFINDLVELDRDEHSRPIIPTTKGEEFMSLTIDVAQSLQGKTAPTRTEKPRFDLQTMSAPLILATPLALRAPPTLKLQTTFDFPKVTKSNDPLCALAPHRPVPLSQSTTESTLSLIGMTPIEVRVPGLDRFLTNDIQEEEEEEELTARPTSGHADRQQRWTRRWDGLVCGSIEGHLASPVAREGGLDGPITPHGYDDISPVTRGEWGFLFQGDTWVKGRCVRVETC